MPGPICIFRPDDPRSSDLRELFTSDIQYHKVVVISIAGRYRQGKSFLLNFMIRYLRAAGASDWLEKDARNELEGFMWKHTQDPVTSGILIWPETFKIRNDSGEEMVVILMDTQGVFDRGTTTKDDTAVFALSVLLSSTQIFNVKQNIQGDDLSHLELFVEFGRLINAESSKQTPRCPGKPFQDLIFLVRDWSYGTENSYGWKGGQEVLQKVLERTDVGPDLVSMRASIRNCFESMKSFLMPHPGEQVDSSPEFRGKLQDIRPVFLANVKAFIEDLFRPSNLKPKRINGQELRVRDFAKFARLYARELHTGQYPEPKRLFEVTVNATNDAVVDKCFAMYQTLISELINDFPRVPVHFEVFHNYVVDNIVNYFKQSRKMGGEIAIEVALNDLLRRIDSAKRYFEKLNSLIYEKKLAELRAEAIKKAAAHLTPLLVFLIAAAARAKSR